MAITAASLLVKVGASTGGAEAALGRVGGLFRGLPGLAVAGVAAVAGIGIASIKMAGDFQSGLTLLRTGAGELQQNMATVSNGILSIAQSTGTGTQDLLASMFNIESAGHRGADGLAVLTAAAQGAKTEQASLAGVTDVLTTAMHNYNLSSSQAVPVVNSLISAVQNGKMTMDMLNEALTGVLPAASKAGVSLTNVEGALAAMAQSGDRGAAAGTHLSQMFLSLQNPSKKAQSALAEIGLTTQQISDDMKRSLPDTLQTIYDALAKKFPMGSAAFNAAAASIVGGNKQVKAWNELTGSSFSDLVQYTNSISDAYTHSGKSVTGFNLVQQTFNFQLSRAKEAVETLFISLGTRLLPIATQLASWIADNLTPAFTGLMDIIAPVRDTANQVGLKLSGLADSIRKMTQPLDEGKRALGQLVNVAKPFPPLFDEASIAGKKVVDVAQKLAPPFDEGGRAVAKFAAATKSSQSPIATIGNILQSVASFVKTDVIPTVQQLATFFVTDMVPALNLVWKDFQADVLPTLGKVANFVRTDVLPVVEKLALWFVTKVVPAAMQVVKWFGDDILPVLRQVWQVVATQVIPVVQGIANNVMANLVPAIERLISKLAPVLIPIFHQVGDVLKNQVGPALNTAIGFVSGLINVVATIIGKIEDFINMLGNVKNAIGNAFSGLNNIPVLGGLLPHFAEGGVMQNTGYALVGERGPEVVRLPGGSSVTPMTAPSTRSTNGLPSGLAPANGIMTATAGGITIPVTLVMDSKKVGMAVVKVTPEIARNATGKRSI